MITVTATNLVRADMASTQISFFDDNTDTRREKSKKIESVIDKIRQKHGNESILSGAIMDSDIGIYDASQSKNNKK